MTLKLARSLTALATLSCALSAFGQILVPSSSVRNTTKPWVVHTDYVINQGPWHVSRYVKQIMTRQGAIEGNYPSMIRQAYGLPATGGSEAIAIIEAYDLPTSLNDFNVFASQFGLPTETSASVTAGTNQVLQVCMRTVQGRLRTRVGVARSPWTWSGHMPSRREQRST
jgi:hypothetical protein